MIVNTEAVSKGKKERRSCIDLGSSYFRTLTVSPDGDPVQERIYVGWGRELSETGSVSRETASRAADILSDLIGMVGAEGDGPVDIVATNVLRSASNRIELKVLLEEKTGAVISVLSEKGEAHLGFYGATSILEPGTPAILVDPGGTSTELALGDSPLASRYISIPVGAHSPNALTWKMPEFPGRDSSLPAPGESHTIVFTGGTAVSLAVIRCQLDGGRYVDSEPMTIPATDLDRLIRALDDPGFSPDLPDERVALLPSGSAIMREITNALRAEEITITARDLRWGVVLGEGIKERGYLADEQESPDSR
jgi:exopolyphosphatase/guanosine-5'-triphosphate,3'-diphosphate pyrophosphatase